MRGRVDDGGGREVERGKGRSDTHIGTCFQGGEKKDVYTSTHASSAFTQHTVTKIYLRKNVVVSDEGIKAVRF